MTTLRASPGRSLMAIAGLLAILSPLQNALAQGKYPLRPVTMIVAFAPGASTDIVARVLAQRLTEQFGVPVLIENKAGANGNIGADFVARAKPDGYTLFYNTSAVTLSPALYVTLSYDVLKDFEPVSRTADGPMVLVVHPSVPAGSVGEFVAYLKANPGKLAYSSAGLGNITHLAAALFLQATGTTALHVPYKVGVQAMSDLPGGQVQFGTQTLSSAMPFIKERRVKALVTTSLTRPAALPDVPTINESVVRGFEAGTWHGVLAPAKLPADLIERLNAEIVRVLKEAAAREKFEAQYYTVRTSTSAEYRAYLHAEVERWGRIIRAAGIKPE